MVLLNQWRDEIATGRVRVVFLDECHLLWGDVCGYVWGPRNQRVEVPVRSEKQRQTYFGALDYLSKQMLVEPHSAGNTDNTIAFLKYLRSLHPQSRLIIIWDGATYHRSHQLREYLDSLNDGLPPQQWPITCIRLAPNAPEQNPIEDIWLQAKQFVRKFYPLCKSFEVVKSLFEFATHQQYFMFPKAFMYGLCSCSI